jgi:hypothetical protein
MFIGKLERSGALAIAEGWGDDQMQNMPSERAFETVARNLPVTADVKPDKSQTNVRLSYTLQRLLSPSPMNSRVTLSTC